MSKRRTNHREIFRYFRVAAVRTLRHTCHGHDWQPGRRLEPPRRVEGVHCGASTEIPVYSFGMNGAPLSQYLAYAEHARDMYRPDALVIPIIENDFGESFRQFQAGRNYLSFCV